MKLIIKIFALIIFFSAKAFATENDTAFFGNLINKMNLYNEKFPSEKLYIQLDKDIYKAGETVWFKAYITEMQKNGPSFLSNGLDIKLFNQFGKAVVEEKYMIENGTVNGDFKLPKVLDDGFYAVTAYSSWMEHDSIDRVFRKFIEVNNSKIEEYNLLFLSPVMYYSIGQTFKCEVLLMSSDGRYIESQKIKYTITDGNKNIFKSDTHTDKSGKATLEVSIPGDVKKAPLFITCEARIEKNPLHFTNIIYPQPEKLNIGFYPEGGNIIAGTRKVVVVNATDLFGKPVGVEGVISDNNGNIITYFKTSESGYGKLLISAQSGEILHAKITKPSGIVQVYQLPEIKEKGISLSIYKTLNDSISFLIETGKNEEPADLKCLMQENGNIFWAGLVTIKKAGLIKIPIGNLFSGVAQLTIFDKNNDIVSQRLVYIDNLNKALIEAKTEGKEYSTRSKVKVNIKIKNIKLLNNSTSLSLSVCKTSLIDSFKNSGIYFSYLLNPELDNFLYSNKYEKIEDFKNTANLFLIANKYHRFSWEKVKNIMPETQGFLTKDGISGLVLSNKGKPLISANVSIINPTTFKLVQSITDNNGWFEAIISEQECDENDYSVTAIAKDGNKKNEIFLANRFGENLKLFAKAKPSFINPGFNYFTDASEPINLDGLLLSQTIKEIKNRNKDKNDAKFNEMRKASLLNPTKKLLDIIAEIKPYSIVGNKIIFAGNLNSINAQTGARFVIDGVLESDDISIVNSINVSDIEDIRIITDPSEILNYTSFANGIIEITTKKGKKPIEDNSSLKHTSKRVYKVTGKFEMPDYSAEKLIGQDNRTTLYWEPVVKINNSGETEVSFYNSDVKGSFTGTLEGIVNGEPVSIVFLYNVK